VLEAIDELDAGPAGYDHLEEELGDLLFQVAFHATLAAEEGQFTLADVARTVHDKLVARHPHVFGPPGEPMPNWEESSRRPRRAGQRHGRGSRQPAVPAVRLQGAGQGGFGRFRLEKRGRGVANSITPP
jgi:hypothetical protein